MSSEKETEFVNRHGKKVSVDGAELVEVPRAAAPTEVVRPQKVEKTQKPRRKRSRRKLLLVLILVVAGLLIAPVLAGEAVAARYTSSYKTAKSELVNFATGTIVPQQKNQMTLAQVTQAMEKVEQIRDGVCEGGLTDNIANLYPRANTALQECISFKQKVAAVASGLRGIESQVRYLESLEPVLEPVSKGTTDEFAVISAQLENWKMLGETLAKLSPAASQRASHDQLKAQASTIADGWSALNTANSNQDATAFADAEKKLSTSYEALRSSRTALVKTLLDAQARLTTNYKQL